MATTDWASAAAFQSECPHTFNALQHLVMAMAGVANNRGKKSFFGRDKGLAAYNPGYSSRGDASVNRS